MSNQLQSVLIDGVSAMAIHNGVARLRCFRLSSGENKAAVGGLETIELCIPVSAIRQIIDALQKVK